MGANGVNNASRIRNDNIHVNDGSRIRNDNNVNDGDYLHRKYRKNYVNVPRINNTSQIKNCSTRQSTSGFNFGLHCFLCGKPVSKKSKQTKKEGSVTCANLCLGSDDWAIAVNGMLQPSNELHAISLCM